MVTLHLRGDVLSPGSAEGIVVPIERLRTSDFDRTRPFIVVAPFITPLHSIYVKDARGIIVEQGGTLSHIAIYSRELGIPCVRLEDATTLLPAGAWVRLSPDGVIEIER